jgi:transposase
MEDGNPSHGHHNTGSRPMQLKKYADITTLKHPGQSPDLNPIELIWMIMKERLRGGSWLTVEAFKEAIM